MCIIYTYTLYSTVQYNEQTMCVCEAQSKRYTSSIRTQHAYVSKLRKTNGIFYMQTFLPYSSFSLVAYITHTLHILYKHKHLVPFSWHATELANMLCHYTTVACVSQNVYRCSKSLLFVIKLDRIQVYRNVQCTCTMYIHLIYMLSVVFCICDAMRFVQAFREYSFISFALTPLVRAKCFAKSLLFHFRTIRKNRLTLIIVFCCSCSTILPMSST